MSQPSGGGGRSIPDWIAMAALLAVGIAGLWLSARRFHAPYVTYDSYQYLAAASNIASGRCDCIDLAHFDEQVRRGRMPIPFTQFAIGYPVILGGLSRAGFPPEQAGYLLNAICYLLGLVVLWMILRRVGASVWVAFGFALLWAVNESTLFLASTIVAESAFTLVVLLLAWLMLKDIDAEAGNRIIAIGIGVLAGISYFIRYPGLFLIPVAAAYLAWRWWRTGDSVGSGAALLAMFGIAGGLMYRNWALSGTWKGAFSSGGGLGIGAAGIEAVKGAVHLVFGQRSRFAADAALALLAVSAIALAVSLAIDWRRRTRTVAPWTKFGWIAALIAVYSAGVVAAALTTIASDFPRYFLPVYPLALALAAAALTRAGVQGYKLGLLAGALLAIGIIHGRSWTAAPPRPPHESWKVMLAESTAAGETLGNVLEQAARTSVLTSAEGQPLHYLLKRPLVSLISHQFSAATMDGQDIHATMRRFRSKYLILLAGVKELNLADEVSPFLDALATGRGEVPEWLTPAARTRHVSVWFCADCDAAR